MNRAARIAAACLLALSCGACKTDDPYWSFALTRGFWGREVTDPTPTGPPIRGEGTRATLTVVAILLAPTAIDVVLLPITLTHDVWFLD